MSLPAPDEKWGPLQSYLYGEHDGPAEAFFFHGNGFSAHTYDPLLRSVAQDISIRAFDLQGHGRSDEIDDIRRIKGWQLYRDNVELALKQNNGGILIGHSMGALSSMFTTMKHPSLVKALVLIEPVFIKPYESLALGLIRLFGVEARGHNLIPQARARRAFFESEDEAAEYFLGRKGLKTWPEEAVRNYAASILRPRRDGEPGLELALMPEWEAQNFANVPGWAWPTTPLPMPVFIARGQHASSTVSDSRLDWLRKRAPHLVVAEHPKAGHMLPVDHAEWTAEQVQAFLKTL